MAAIVGVNGCGKSTLLKTLAGFIPLVSGKMHWKKQRPVMGWLAQRHALESQFPVISLKRCSLNRNMRFGEPQRQCFRPLSGADDFPEPTS